MAYMQLDSGTVIETANPELWREAKRLPAPTGRQIMEAEAHTALLEMLAPGDTVYTILRHCSRSGMFRRIDLYKMTAEGPQYLSGYAARVMGESLHKDGGIGVSGCGMDMGFHLVYNLSRTLFRDGFAPSTRATRGDSPVTNLDVGRGRNAGPMTQQEIAELVAKGWKFQGGRNGDASGWDTDGGYALRHEWL